MIARTWHGRLDTARVDEYLPYVRETGVTDLRNTPGNQGVLMLLDRSGPVTDFIMISFWDSMESIRKFAGDDVTRAVYYERDREYLHELEPHVGHYEVDTAVGPFFR